AGRAVGAAIVDDVLARAELRQVDGVVAGAAIDGDGVGRKAGAVEVADHIHGVPGGAEVDDQLLHAGVGDRELRVGFGGADADAEMGRIDRADHEGFRGGDAVDHLGLVAAAADHGVDAVAHGVGEGVGAGAAIQGIVADAANNEVGAVARMDGVVTAAAHQQVVAVAGGDDVVAGTALDDVVAVAVGDD